MLLLKQVLFQASTPVYTADGQSYYISNNTSTWNGVKVWYAQSSSTGFSNSTNTDDWGTYVVDGNYSNTKWYIGMNWGGTALPGRWSNENAVDAYTNTPMVLALLLVILILVDLIKQDFTVFVVHQRKYLEQVLEL